jgi:regulator of sirC expression with transglutaminase-like and TPR domain
MDDFGLPPGYSKNEYRGILNYEGILGTHVTNMMKYSDNDIKQYCSSIETFIRWCPEEIRNKGYEKLQEMGLQRRRYEGLTPEKLVLYDDLIIYINGLLEKRNIIFRTGTFEIGHD